MIFYMRDPATMGDDEWKQVISSDLESAIPAFRKRWKMRDDAVVEVQREGIIARFPPPFVPPQLPRQRGQKYERSIRKKHCTSIRSLLAQRPGLTVNQILAVEFGEEALAAFVKMLYMRGEIFSLAREGRLKKDEDRYYIS